MDRSSLLAGSLCTLVVLLEASCGLELEPCDELPEHLALAAPPTLHETGLYGPDDVLAEGVRAFVPQFPLWTDGAAKHRFIALPPDTVIDTSDPDDWVFPVGTQVWKEFERDGVRAETRLLRKVDDGTWLPATYVWRADQSGADLMMEGAEDVLGTPHDVPAAKDCAACHSGAKDWVLGFSAIQLAHAGAGLGVDVLEREGLVSHPIGVDALQLPGDATARRALGVLHANCGHCHNALRKSAPSATCFTPTAEASEFELKLQVNELDAVKSTATYRTTVNAFAGPFKGSLRLIRPGKPHRSLIHRRMIQRDGVEQMPPLGTEDVDQDGLAAVDAWIRSL